MSGEAHFRQEMEDDDLVPRITLNDSMDNFVVVDGLPIATQEKVEKLKEVLTSVYSKVGKVKNVVMPLDPETNSSRGFAFVEYEAPEEARLALKLNNKEFGKTNVMKVNRWGDFARYDKIPDEYNAPTLPRIPDNVNLYSWLEDPMGCDQYLINRDNFGEVFRNGHAGEKPTSVFKKEDWSDQFFIWSPCGTYLATRHRQGVRLWGGPNFELLMKFEHPGVVFIEFSPRENFLITINPEPKQNKNEDVIFWDITTGYKLRAFPLDKPFQWSFDDQYVATLKNGLVTIYETPSMKILDKKSLMLNKAITDFCWSPTQNYLSVFVPEQDSIPARIVIYKIPERKEIAQKNLFNVEDCKMHWHSGGDFLAVKIDIKIKKVSHTSFEFFRMREKGLPVESIAFQDFVLAFAWEPKGNRFAVIHEPEPNSQRKNVSFYTLEGKKIQKLATLEKRPANALFWSPTGKNIVLAGFRNFNGKFEFYNVDEKESYVTEVNHQLATNVEWDPTGRYVVIYVSHYYQKLENGFSMWSFIGKNLYNEAKEKFFQFLWRPRPPTLLSVDEEKEIEKKWPLIAEQYRKEDEEKRKARSTEKKNRKKKQREEFDEYMAERLKEYDSEREQRKALRGGIDSDDESNWTITEEVVERVIDETRENV